MKFWTMLVSFICLTALPRMTLSFKVLLFIAVYFNVTLSTNNVYIDLNSAIAAKIINNYFEKYLMQQNFFVSLTYFSSNNEQLYFQKSILTHLLNQSIYSYSVTQNKIRVHSRRRTRFNIILVDNFTTFS